MCYLSYAILFEHQVPKRLLASEFCLKVAAELLGVDLAPWVEAEGSALSSNIKERPKRQKYTQRRLGKGGIRRIIAKSLRLTFTQLLLAQLPQLIHLRRLSRHSALRNLDPPPHKTLIRNRIRRSHGLDFNNPDPWIIRATIMLSVAEVAHPGFQRGRVVFVDEGAVGGDGGFAGNGSPFARGVQEGDVDIGVGFEVVGFAGFSVRVEEEIDTAGFLGPD